MASLSLTETILTEAYSRLLELLTGEINLRACVLMNQSSARPRKFSIYQKAKPDGTNVGLSGIS